MDLSQDEFRDNIGQETIKMTLTDSTRMQYSAALNRFKRWLSDNNPDLLDEGNDILLPIPSSVMTTFMYHAMLEVHKNGQYLDPPEFYSLNHVNAYRNAIKNFYHEKKAPMGDEMEGVLKDKMSAYIRRIADLKAQGEMSMHEGKQPTSQSGYRYLAEAAIQQSDDFNLYITCHCFLLLCWNVIARAVSVGIFCLNRYLG